MLKMTQIEIESQKVIDSSTFLGVEAVIVQLHDLLVGSAAGPGHCAILLLTRQPVDALIFIIVIHINGIS